MVLHDYDAGYFMDLDIGIGIPLLTKMREKVQERMAFQMWTFERLYMCDKYVPFDEYWKPRYIAVDTQTSSDDAYAMAERIRAEIAQKGERNGTL